MLPVNFRYRRIEREIRKAQQEIYIYIKITENPHTKYKLDEWLPAKEKGTGEGGIEETLFNIKTTFVFYNYRP